MRDKRSPSQNCKGLEGNMANLWILCRDGKLDEVRSALARGEDVNDKDSFGKTSLMFAVNGRHNSIVKLLADPTRVSQLNCASH